MSDIQFDNPFHAGEIAVQERVGSRERVALSGRRLIRPTLIDQHREFYAQLPFLVLGSNDAQGRPWASIVAGQPGFLSTPDYMTLDVAAQPVPGDPLAENLELNGDIGVVGVQLETRRRNRLSGRISALREDGFSIRVLQSYGNCPQYIQKRAVGLANVSTATVIKTDQFDAGAERVLAQADTLFIATSFRDNQSAANQGTDASHRGGKPGFVKVEGPRSLIFPDFKGNNIYNTIGNLVANPRAGILVPDFITGDLLTMTGKAEIVWDGPEVQAFEGALRLVRFHAKEMRRISGGLAIRTEFLEYAPQLANTGDWNN